MTSLALRVNGVSRRVSMVRFADLLRDLDRAVGCLERDLGSALADLRFDAVFRPTEVLERHGEIHGDVTVRRPGQEIGVEGFGRGDAERDGAVGRLGRDPVLERQSFETDVAVSRLRLELSFKAADL